MPVYAMLGFEPRALCVKVNTLATELYPEPCWFFHRDHPALTFLENKGDPLGRMAKGNRGPRHGRPMLREC